MKVGGGGSQHSCPLDQPHLCLACLQGEGAAVSTVFPVSEGLRQLGGWRLAVTLACHSASSTLSWGPAELKVFVSLGPARFLCLSLPLGDAQAPGYFYLQYLSCLSPLFQLLCCYLGWGLDLLSLACCSGFLTSLPAGFRSASIFCYSRLPWTLTHLCRSQISGHHRPDFARLLFAE